MSHRGGTARNRLGALITRDTQRRRGCVEGADGSAWDNSELAEEIGLPDGSGGGDHLLEVAQGILRREDLSAVADR